MELLSPAGTLECGMAALHYGADAVYLGMKDFSARADAGNFTFEELSVLAGVAHGMEKPRKVYVAVNTLLHEDELPPLIDMLARLREIPVDAIIVQDMSVVDIVRSHLPGIPLHASTQLAIHSLAGAIAAKKAGFSRIVAARELSMTELADIAARSGVEVEAFIHGALCYSYSGLCLMSAMLNGASGNRGDCTYVCRNKFSIRDDAGKQLGECCPFSMKDLALAEVLPEFRKAGIASLKIEGRKKTPLYVAAVTNYYRKLLDKSFKPGEELQASLDVKTIFSRPWTKLFTQSVRATEVTDPSVVGPRGIEVGLVQKVRQSANGDHLRFTLRNRPIEKHDGLQVEIPGVEKPYGFGVDELFAFTQGGQDRWASVFKAEPGSTIEVPLPENHPDFPAGSKISCTSSQDIKRRYQWPEPRTSLDKARNDISFRLTLAPEKAEVESTVHLPSGDISGIHTELDITPALQPANNSDRLEGDITRAFERLGDTDFRLKDIFIDNPQKLYAPKSLLNDLRRKAAQDAQDAIAKNTEAAIAAARSGILCAMPPSKATQISLDIKLDRPFLLNAFAPEDINNIGELVFAMTSHSISSIDSSLDTLQKIFGGKSRIRLAIPPVIRAQAQQLWARTAMRLHQDGWLNWEATNIASWEILAEAGITPQNASITADWPLYSMNTMAARHWLQAGAERVTACPEDQPENIIALAKALGDKFTVPLLQDTVLAYSAACAMASIRGFCPGKPNCHFTTLSLTNSRGATLEAVNDNCTTVILNSDPLDLTPYSAALSAAGPRHFRLDFLYKDHAPVEIIRSWRRILDYIR